MSVDALLEDAGEFRSCSLCRRHQTGQVPLAKIFCYAHAVQCEGPAEQMSLLDCAYGRMFDAPENLTFETSEGHCSPRLAARVGTQPGPAAG